MLSRSFFLWLFACCCVVVDAVRGGDLRRKAMFGAVLDVAKEGVMLKRVLAGSSAAESGFLDGDIVLQLNDVEVPDVAAFLDALSDRHGGDRMAVEFVREGMRKRTTVTLKEKPREKGDGYEVVYSSVRNGAIRQRTIITRPPGGGRHPAVLLLQGGHTCFPVDDPFGRPGAFIRIAQHLARNGYVTMRIERPGCGDSEGPPLREVDFETELAGNIAGVRALKQSEYVDPERVLIYGFSMGGFFAPLIAQEESVRGIATYGTTCGTFFEGVTGQRRRFLLLEGKSPAQVNEEIIGHIRFWHQLLVERLTVREIVDNGSAPPAVLDQWAKEPPYVAGRHFRFYHQLAELNLAETWAEIARSPKAPWVLALLGEFDWHTTPAEGADWIVRSVNAARPGHAASVVIPGSDHFSNRVTSAKESFDVLYGRQPRPTAPFNPAILQILLTWCDATVGKSKN